MTIFRMLAICVISTSCISAALADHLRTVVLSEQHAPGTPEGTGFKVLYAPAINNLGQVAFWAELNTGSGIWSEGVGILNKVYFFGDEIIVDGEQTKFGGANYGSDIQNINSAGETFFVAGIRKMGVIENTMGIWKGGAGVAVPIALQSNHAPGTPDNTVFDTFVSFPVVNKPGHVAFKGLLQVGSGDTIQENSSGIWSNGDGELKLVARTGSQAPGMPIGTLFNTARYSTFENLTLNDRGHIAFQGSLLLGSGDVTARNRSGIWSNRDGNLGLVIRGGQIAPGATSDEYFASFSDPILNNSGDIVFTASLRSDTGAVNDNNNFGVWTERQGQTSLVAREGFQVPGLPQGRFFNHFQTLEIDREGYVTFSGGWYVGPKRRTSEISYGIWSNRSGELKPLALTNDPVPGTPAGTLFQSFTEFVMNASGQIAFVGTLRKSFSSVSDHNDTGIWAQNRNGILQLIAREGDFLEVVSGDFRTVSFLKIIDKSSIEDLQGSGFNDRGQIAFLAHFTDGSQGVFVSNLVAVPEPNTLLSAIVFCILLSAGGRCHLPLCFAGASQRG